MDEILAVLWSGACIAFLPVEDVLPALGKGSDPEIPSLQNN
jgi:hypothetical protein